MITRDGISHFFERLYEIGVFDDRIYSPNTPRVGWLPVNFFLGIVPTVFVLMILGIAGNPAVSLIVMFLVGPLIGSVFRRILVSCYQLFSRLIRLIPKDEEEAYQRKMQRPEKKKKKRKNSEVSLAAYGGEDYQVVDEEKEISFKRK